jgi:hypothetical protein
MKIFGFIMGAMVLALSCMPCADNAFAMKSGNNVSVVSKPPCQNEKGRADDCSPFCQCSCCAGFSLNQNVVNFALERSYNDIAYNSYLLSHIAKIAYPIFQPPKL